MKTIIEGAYYKKGNGCLVGPMEKTDLYNNFVYIWTEKVTKSCYTNFGQVFQNAKDIMIDLDINKPLKADGTPFYEEKVLENESLKFCKDCKSYSQYRPNSFPNCLNKECRELDLVSGEKSYIKCHAARNFGKCGKEGLYYERIEK